MQYKAHSYIEQFKQRYKNKRIQFVLLDKAGYLVESCDTLVSLSNYHDVSLFDINPFLESIKDVLASLLEEPDKIALPLSYPRLEVPLLTREGVFDYSFESFIDNNKHTPYLVWIIEDNTDLYQYLWKVQQERNETAIRKELIMIQTQKIIQLHRLIKEKTDESQQKSYQLKQQLYYAEKIQRGIQLPAEQKLNATFIDSFVLSLAKQQASGDTFYIAEILHQQQRYVLLGIADCTGFGVVGSILALAWHFVIKEIVEIERIIQPKFILYALESRLTQILAINAMDCPDVIEVALVMWQPTQQLIQFAGAKRGIFIAQGEQLTYITGSPYSLLGTKHDSKVFEQQTLNLSTTSKLSLYLFTDGYADQFSEATNKKMGLMSMQSLIKKHLLQIMAEQKQALQSYFQQWKGQQEQTDDVLIVGVQLV